MTICKNWLRWIKLDKVKEKEKLYNTVSKLYNKWFENHYDEWCKKNKNKK